MYALDMGAFCFCRLATHCSAGTSSIVRSESLHKVFPVLPANTYIISTLICLFLQEVAEAVKNDFGTIDVIVHSLANGPEVGGQALSRLAMWISKLVVHYLGQHVKGAL